MIHLLPSCYVLLLTPIINKKYNYIRDETIVLEASMEKMTLVSKTL